MELKAREAASVQVMRDGMSEVVSATAGAFRDHLTQMSIDEHSKYEIGVSAKIQRSKHGQSI